MKKNKIGIGIIIVLLFLVLVLFIGVNTKTMNTQEDKTIVKSKVKIIEKKQRTLEEIRKNENIVFLGDSITDFYPIDDIYLNLPIINSGISGYKTTDILSRMDDMVYKYNPTKVFLLIGTNDLNFTDDTQSVEDNIIEIVESIKKNRSKAKIYIQSIYPVNKDVNPEVVSNRNNEKIKTVNEFLKSYCEENNIIYIDMYNLLVDSEGNLDSKYTKDGLHENELGYARISQVLIKYIYDLEI